ncbi:hypothetical protein D0962_36740 [Leptolyngbyaceae cyanobacterium CCMR0082]|uniref:Cytochrome c domain-containing protein n=1 Tax=Adonisia turfae CCMR0082 TaxID=2304604 RepID=A0A6M0SI67_9CYAN|nr:hypothetical protein [Adonisia turfae CCMR0082]
MLTKVLHCLLALILFLFSFYGEASANIKPKVADLNQGWSQQEVQFFNHASEGTNLAPLEFFLNLPDPKAPDTKFIDKLGPGYGFIPSKESELNPYGLPIGFAIDQRPVQFGDRPYVGITCAACHARQLTYRPNDGSRSNSPWILPVYGGPGLVDIPQFLEDLYGAFYTLLDDDAQIKAFATDVLGNTPTQVELDQLKDEISEFIGPYGVATEVMDQLQIPAAEFGPGNLNALTRGYYNNVGIIGWMVRKGIIKSSGKTPLRIQLEGSTNYPPLWFAHQDTWAQWFAEIHHPSARNWIQSVSTSPIRPPKMIEAFKKKVILESIDFDNIEKIQNSLERLRTPKWPESVLGQFDQTLIAQGKPLFEQNCAQCHTRTSEPPNRLGIQFNQRLAFDVGTDPVAYQIFNEHGKERADGLLDLSKKMLRFRKFKLWKEFGYRIATNYQNHDSKGRPNKFAIAKEQYSNLDNNSSEKSGAVYWASPLAGIFASSPYFHNGSVPTLWDVLSVPEQRPTTFQTGGNEFDPDHVGLRAAGSFLYDTREEGKSNGGHLFGTKLSPHDKTALIEYLKSL